MKTLKLVIFIVLLKLLTTVQNVDAKTITVHNTADDGPGSLRQAIVQAANGDKINIVVNGTITLTSGELIVSKNLTISGPGPHGTISGNNTSRVFHITPGMTVTLDSLTIVNGAASTDPSNFPDAAGGGIYNDHAKLTISNCTVSGNAAVYGGALFNNAENALNPPLAVNNTTFSNNYAILGGGIYNDSEFGVANFVLNNCGINNNSAQFGSGGGIFNDGYSGSANATLNNCTVNNNSAQTGGGIYNDGYSGSAATTLIGCTISDNSAVKVIDVFNVGAGGGIFNEAYFGSVTLTLDNSTVTANSANYAGGGIYNDGYSGNVVLILNTTSVSNNKAGELGNQTVNGYGLGGGILNNAIYSGAVTSTLSNCAINNNTAGADGGGINNVAQFGGSTSLKLTKCSVSNNQCSDNAGGIYNYVFFGATGTLKATDSTLAGNSSDRGGAILNEANGGTGTATVTVTKCALTGNTTGDSFFGSGGGLDNQGSNGGQANANLTNCLITDNFAQDGGGLCNEFGLGTLTVSKCTISHNQALHGGGIFIDCSLGTSFVTDCTINDNSTLGGAGGGIWNSALLSPAGALKVTNSTVSNNTSYEAGGIINLSGGGILDPGNYGNPDLVLDHCTISGNSGTVGGGIYSVSEGGGTPMVDMSNTIINAGPVGENIRSEVFTIFTSHGYNLSSDAAGGDNTSGPGGSLNAPGDIRNTNPMLGPLQNNGGPTMTHALLSGSPAINAGDPNFNPYLFNPPLLYDQRGPGFPRVVGGRLDIGAFEAGPH